MLPKKSKTVGYKPNLTSQKTSENGSLNTKPNKLKKKQTREEMWISIDPMKCINTTMQPATVFIVSKTEKTAWLIGEEIQ